MITLGETGGLGEDIRRRGRLRDIGCMGDDVSIGACSSVGGVLPLTRNFRFGGAFDGPGVVSTSISASESSVIIALPFPFRLLLTTLLMRERDDEATDASRADVVDWAQDAKNSGNSGSVLGPAWDIHLGQYQSPGGACSSGGLRQSICQPDNETINTFILSKLDVTHLCHKNHKAIGDSESTDQHEPSRNRDRRDVHHRPS